jgi:hypothetical protein
MELSITDQKKEIARDFLQLIIKGKIDEAYDKYIDHSGSHHNVYIPTDTKTTDRAFLKPEKKIKKYLFSSLVESMYFSYFNI